jgi:hypothetical protein
MPVGKWAGSGRSKDIDPDLVFRDIDVIGGFRHWQYLDAGE